MNLPRTRNQREKALQVEIVQWLALAVPRSRVYEFARVGGRPKCPKCGTWVGRLAGGMPKSWPDMLIVIEQKPWPIWIPVEVKAEDNDLTDGQKLLKADMAQIGVTLWRARSVQDVYDVLVANGIRPRLRAE